jgi:hypothetical protein
MTRRAALTPPDPRATTREPAAADVLAFIASATWTM